MTNSRDRTFSVSVVIPAYNRAGDLPGAVESVLAQTHPVHEIILVDDGSQDDTPEIARSLPGPVRYIRQENQGVSRARNRGLSEAQGDLIALLDTDDRWDPRKLEIQEAVMAAHLQVGWSATDIRLVRADHPARTLGGLERAVPVFGERRREPAEWFRTRLEHRAVELDGSRLETFVGDAFGLLLNGNFVFPSTVVLRRSLVDEVGGFDPSFPRAEETDFFLRLAAASPLAMIDLPLTTYRTGGGDSLTAAAHTVELTEFALRAVKAAVNRKGSLSTYERHAADMGCRAILLRQAYAHLSNLDGQKARRSLARLRDEGLAPGPKGNAILAISLLPVPVLRGLRWAKGALPTPWDGRFTRKRV